MSPKLLVVDDDKSIREVVEISLEDDWNIVTASSGAEALEKAGPEKPDLILLDRMMPGMDGVETLKHLRENPETMNIPVIFLTAKVQSQEIAAYGSLDVLGVLSKPFDPMTLSDEIAALLKKTNNEKA
ncbi:MAG: response regulator [Candidatus Obscuribacterales bacterium]|nr:response regulator [Candidatus Obscuribacterales bacterium]